MAFSTDSEGSPFRPCDLLYLPLALHLHHSLAKYAAHYLDQARSHPLWHALVCQTLR